MGDECNEKPRASRAGRRLYKNIAKNWELIQEFWPFSEKSQISQNKRLNEKNIFFAALFSVKEPLVVVIDRFRKVTSLQGKVINVEIRKIERRIDFAGMVGRRGIRQINSIEKSQVVEKGRVREWFFFVDNFVQRVCSGIVCRIGQYFDAIVRFRQSFATIWMARSFGGIVDTRPSTRFHNEFLLHRQSFVLRMTNCSDAVIGSRRGGRFYDNQFRLSRWWSHPLSSDDWTDVGSFDDQIRIYRWRWRFFNAPVCRFEATEAKCLVLCVTWPAHDRATKLFCHWNYLLWYFIINVALDYSFTFVLCWYWGCSGGNTVDGIRLISELCYIIGQCNGW